MKNKRDIRLFVTGSLNPGESLTLPEKSSHYLCNVMRCRQGEQILCFNSQQGEFLCNLKTIDKRATIVCPIEQTKTPHPEPDVWLLFAPLKKDKTDFVIEKAVELGVKSIAPVITRYTNSDKVKVERFEAQAVEACEQCGRLSIPEICQPLDLSKILEAWDSKRVLFFMDEQRNGLNALQEFEHNHNRPAALLIGPEGGFSAEERALLNRQKFVRNISLGPRILRAETAALAALTLWQSTCGDWNNKGALK
jgi:16S rRNA (uracil1498-N3)-methyltransferase